LDLLAVQGTLKSLIQHRKTRERERLFLEDISSRKLEISMGHFVQGWAP